MTADPILCVHGVRKTYARARPRCGPYAAAIWMSPRARPASHAHSPARAAQTAVRRAGPSWSVRMTAPGARPLRLLGQALTRSTGRRPFTRPNVIG
jgi:hypothetical protein